MKKTIRLTESDLVKLVKRVINEQSQPQGLTQTYTQNKNGVITSKTKVNPPASSPKAEYKLSSGPISGVAYTVQQDPQTKKFRIFVTTPKFKTPTDASKVFGQGTMWVDYNTSAEAEKVIQSLSGGKDIE
jgi:hypothetical protein